MKLHAVDLAIIVLYFSAVVLVGLWVSRRGAKDMDSYFLGGKNLPWWLLGISDASGMFDISGTMWLVYILFVYGMKSLWLPWLWPVFNQIFLMMFLSSWLRRSNVLTGAEWIQTRFGRGPGANLAHLSVVFFALVNVVAFLAYAFKGIGKFASVMLPWHFTNQAGGFFSDANIYALAIMCITALYAIKGGMVSVVITEVMQFAILTVTSLAVGFIAVWKVPSETIHKIIPPGWTSPFFGLKMDLDWTGILDSANKAIKSDGNEFFSLVFGLMFFKGVLASLAGPAPNYDMQRILATRSPREAGMMNGMVNLALYFPRYLLIAGITILALAYLMPDLHAMNKPDFELLLPIVLRDFIPVGVLGLLLAGLLAALMSNFAATLNAAPAYIVNDIYKRFFDPEMPPHAQVRWSRTASVLVLLIGVLFGAFTTSIAEVMMWIVGGLYGGYVMANVLKWYWWRFNGYGYFGGMMAGLLSAMFVPSLAVKLNLVVANQLYLLPVILGFSLAGCLFGALLTEPDEEEVLKCFYQKINPWGFWGPIRVKVQSENHSFLPNPNFRKDMANVAVGILWQLCLTALPIYLILRDWTYVASIFVILVLTSIFLKFNWYDKLEDS